MADEINVTIGAKIDELITEFKKAASTVTESVKSIEGAVAHSMAEVQQSTAKTGAALRKTESDAAEASRGIKGSLGEVGSFLQGFMGTLLAGFSVKAAVTSVLDFADAAESLTNVAQIAGTTATAISRLHATATPLGIDAGAVDNGMKKLAKTMTEAARGGDEQAKALDAVGIKAQDLKNMSIEQVIAKISDKFKGSEDGATKSALAMALMGRSGADLIPWLNMGSESMDKAADSAAAMGAVMGVDAVAAGNALDNAMDTLHLQAQGLKNVFGQALAPVLQYIAEMFTDGSGTAMDFGSVFKVVGSIVVGVVAVVREAWAIVSSIVRGITIAITSVVTAVARAASGDFSGAKSALVDGKNMIQDEMKDLVSSTVDIAEKAKGAFQNVWNGVKPEHNPMEGVGTGTIDYKPKESVEAEASAAASKAAAAAKQAAKDKFDYEMEMLRGEMMELQKGAEQKIAIAKQVTEAVKQQYGEQSREFLQAKQQEKQIVQEVEAEKRRIADAALSTAREHAELEINLARGNADKLVAMGEMTAVERVQLQEKTEEQIYALQMSYLQQRLTLMATEPQEVERINQEIIRLKGEHQLAMQQLDIQTFDANKAQWDNYFQVINDGLANSIQGMIFQGQTWQQAMGTILQNIAATWIQTQVKTLTSHIANEQAKTASTLAGNAVRSASDAAAAKQSIVANAGAAIKNILNKAAEVFANVYNAIAGIPYVGPFLAPAMAVAAGATVVGLVGRVASAEGGWERVPYDGAMAQLHKDEMVLPAALSDGLRKLVENGSGTNGGIHIHAMDRRDVQRYFDDNPDLLFGAMAQYAANSPGGF